MGDWDHRSPLLPRTSSKPQGSDSAESGDLTHRNSNTSGLLGKLGHSCKTIINKHNVSLVVGPLATVLIFCYTRYHGFHTGSSSDEEISSNKVGAMLGALVWIASWWMLEPIPIAITSLLPVVLFPIFGIMDADEVAPAYMNDKVILMLGSFILALAISRYGLHKRMALKILLLAGGEKMDPRLVLLGFIIGPAFISMWMSNTSTAAMMIPMATGVLGNLHPGHHVTLVRSKSSILSEEAVNAANATVPENEENGDNDGKSNSEAGISDDEKVHEEAAAEAIRVFSQGVIIGVTYGVAFGGAMTLIGCGANMVLPGIYKDIFPDGPEVTFLDWMKFGVPLGLLAILVLWLFLCWRYSPSESLHMIEASLNRSVIERAYKQLGPITFAETFIFADFCVLVALWTTRTFGQSAPGWGALFDNLPGNGTVAVAASVVLFMVPNHQRKGEMIMDWKTCKNISWSVLLLLGGGFCLSKGIQKSGLSTWIGASMEFFEYVPYFLLIPVLSTMLSAITEFSSNSATATLFLPIFAEVALTVNVHPLLLMVPVTFASNYAFVMPSGAPPNAIAVGTGYLTIKDLGPPGLFMHLVGLILISVLTPTLGAWVWGVNQPASSLPWT